MASHPESNIGTNSSTTIPVIRDNHGTHIWFWEPSSSSSSSSSSSGTTDEKSLLTEEGLDQIIHHQYKAGTYTIFDLQLNPIWQNLTDQLPLWMAPNTVTAIGGFFTILSYGMTAIYSPDFQQDIPSFILILNGFCLMAYYTLDCMDGKQARRTGTSSPLGQLFDHGCDCIANISHVSLMHGIVQFKSYQYMIIQMTMQLGFFQAQLEEYYTRSLPHAAGNIGTTEVLYGISLWSILTGIIEIILYGRWNPKDDFYNQPLSYFFPNITTMIPTFMTNVGTYLFHAIPGLSYAVNTMTSTTTTAMMTPSASSITRQQLVLRDCIVIFWVYGFGILTILSWIRIVRYLFTMKYPSNVSSTTNESYRLLTSAIAKWISPMILCILAYITCCSNHYDYNEEQQDKNNTSILTSSSTIQNNIRYPSLCFGLCFSFLTIKLVVFGMARMAYASIQFADLLPLLFVTAFTATTMRSSSSSSHHHDSIYQWLAVGYSLRLILWTRSVVKTLCQKMKIHLFRIPSKTTTKKQT